MLAFYDRSYFYFYLFIILLFFFYLVFLLVSCHPTFSFCIFLGTVLGLSRWQWWWRWCLQWKWWFLWWWFLWWWLLWWWIGFDDFVMIIFVVMTFFYVFCDDFVVMNMFWWLFDDFLWGYFSGDELVLMSFCDDPYYDFYNDAFYDDFCGDFCCDEFVVMTIVAMYIMTIFMGMILLWWLLWWILWWWFCGDDSWWFNLFSSLSPNHHHWINLHISLVLPH